VADAKRTTGKSTESVADTMKAAADKAKQGFTDHVAEPARRAGERMKDAGAKAAENSSAIGVKLLDQAEANMKEAFAAMRAAADAKDLSQVMKIQGDFLRDQGSRSMTQAREVGELILQFGRDAVAPITKRD
jgi:phasin family protein